MSTPAICASVSATRRSRGVQVGLLNFSVSDRMALSISPAMGTGMSTAAS